MLAASKSRFIIAPELKDTQKKFAENLSTRKHSFKHLKGHH